MSDLVNWIDQRFPLKNIVKKYFSEYYVPKNLNFFYLFGILSLLVLFNQLLSGLWLTMFYTPTVQQAFNSIEYIMREVNYGWLLRYLHSTGASAFFIVIYLHIFRALLYGSYQKPRELVWLLGVLLFLLLLAEAFFGYLLPWGQMSYWGAQVITSLLESIPWLGKTMTIWLRGGFSVGNATLQRFFALHIIAVPLLLLFFVFIHIVALRKVGSNNPQGIDIKKYTDGQGTPLDSIPFHSYYSSKELVSLIVFLMVFFAVVFFAPDMGGYFLERSNAHLADPMVTPDHIAPMWYMAPFYTILRSIPHKSLGIFAMGGAMLMLLFMPWLDRSPVRSMRYKGKWSQGALVAFIISFLLLGYLGTVTITPIKQFIARICTIIYFAYFFMMPFYSRYERCKIVPERIA